MRRVVTAVVRVSLVIGLLLAHPGLSHAELTDEQMREMGATDEKIRILRGLEPAPRRGPRTGADFLAAGPSTEKALTKVIAFRGEQGLALAREVLFREDRRGKLWADYGVFNGLSKQSSAGGVELLRDAILELYGPTDPRWETSRIAWAGAFYALHGDERLDLAEQALQDTSLSAEDRALHLLVFSRVGTSKKAPERSRALQVYRPHLESDAPALQRAAVLVSRALWDYEAVATLKQLALTSSDIKVRINAYPHVQQLLRYGPDLETLERNVRGTVTTTKSYDALGYRDWLDQLPQWKKDNYRLATGVDPPPDWPPPPPRERQKFRQADTKREGAGSGLSQRRVSE